MQPIDWFSQRIAVRSRQLSDDDADTIEPVGEDRFRGLYAGRERQRRVRNRGCSAPLRIVQQSRSACAGARPVDLDRHVERGQRALVLAPRARYQSPDVIGISEPRVSRSPGWPLRRRGDLQIRIRAPAAKMSETCVCARPASASALRSSTRRARSKTSRAAARLSAVRGR